MFNGPAVAETAFAAVSSTGLGPAARPDLSAPSSDDAALRAVARDFETTFIAEMLKAAKIGEIDGPFTGGHGEEAFRSFLLQEYAESISESGGFGLADQIYRQLQQRISAYD